LTSGYLQSKVSATSEAVAGKFAAISCSNTARWRPSVETEQASLTLSHRPFLISGIVIAVLALGATAWILGSRLTQEKTPSGEGMVSVPTDLSGPFDLVDQRGRAVTQADFKGEKVLLYFGYTFCPDICPTSLQVIATALDDLGPAGTRVRPLFITLDPERDRAEQLGDYVGLFHERMVGLTGTQKQTDAVARDFRVYFTLRKDVDPIEYPVDHSSYIYLMDEAWNLTLVFRHDVSPEIIAAALREQL
jgi:protein SCO1/2